MKNLSGIIIACFCLFAMLTSSATKAQSTEKRASPADSVTAKAGNSTIKVSYSSPSVKGRKIWGGLVPYNEVWRTGANEATTFTTSADIMVEGKLLPAGRYGFFAIPTEKEWTIIFNKVPNQWGAFNYDEKKDALRVKVKPRKGAMKEHLVYTINGDGIVLAWENLEVPVSIKKK